MATGLTCTPARTLHSSASVRVCSPSAQWGDGGGLYVAAGGVANLDGCNVFSNEAYVRPPYAPSLSLLQRPAGTFRVLAFCMQGSPSGGGLIVYGTATLTNTNVYANVAYVRLHFEPS